MFLLVLVVSVVLIALSAATQQKIYGQALLTMWGLIIALVTVTFVGMKLRQKKILDQDDFYGTYVIDRSYFPGVQANWQYNHYRFEIKKNDSIYFYTTNGVNVIATHKGVISTSHTYQSARLIIEMEQPTHHVLTTNPTIYRSAWSFFMVFNSPKYHNMYFKKGTWKELE